MSLLDANYEKFVIMDQKTVDDPEGGYTSDYVPGATIQAVAVKDTTTQAVIAGTLGATALYTITTPKSVILKDKMVIRREEDQKIFRVRADGEDSTPPKGAGIKFRNVRAEEWVIPK